METLPQFFENNKAWAARIRAEDPAFFESLSAQQLPEYLWIGCSDSRVPANQIVDMLPGTIFVHRNVSNLVVHSDLNCLSVLQFAVDVLQVKHVIVCGHYRCGGVRAALLNQRHGLVDHWLRHIRDVKDKHADLLGSIAEEETRWDRLCELNVIEQVLNLCNTTIIPDAWQRGQQLHLHGWIYGLNDGLLTDLGMTIGQRGEVPGRYQKALEKIQQAG